MANTRILYVGYDLSQPDPQYSELHDALRSVPWCRPLKSDWLIRTDATAVQVRDFLRQFLQPSDKLFVIEVDMNSWATSGAFSKEVLEWLHAHGQ